MGDAVRTLVVWWPDWPVVAAGASLDEPVAVMHANRVVACSPAARGKGVTVGLRRRDAQARCPALLVLPADPAGEARAFEPVAAALEALTPRVHVMHPGCVAMHTRGPSRYHGGDLALARAAALLAVAAGPGLAGPRPPGITSTPSPNRSGAGFAPGTVGVGVADGVFAARLAARRAPGGDVGNVLVVPPGESRSFLAPLPMGVLDLPDFVGVLGRLGLRTLGELAALPEGNVVGRFGREGMAARRLASGLDPRPPATRAPPPDMRVEVVLDPPAELVETTAFAARGLADRLHRRLTQRGSACTLLLIGAETDHGERHERIWRTDGSFSPAAIADRLRWQLDGWLHARANPPDRSRPERPHPPGIGDEDLSAGVRTWAQRPTGGITRLWLYPEEVVAAGGRQLGFGVEGRAAVIAAKQADRALARVQSLVGVEGALLPEWRGGRGPGERMVLVDAGDADLTEPRLAASREWVNEPWPGAIPEPAPAIVYPRPSPVRLLDEAGNPLRVSGRGVLSADPATLATRERGHPDPVVNWAGPWPCNERWWDAANHHRRARLQVVTRTGTAHLLILEAGRWALEATYD